MVNKKFLLGMLVLTLVFGMTVLGCDDEPEDTNKNSQDEDYSVPPSGGQPALTGTVTITGNAVKGGVLTADTTSLDGSGTITYQWKRGDTDYLINTPIGNSSTYTLTNSDLGKYIAVTVSRADNSDSVTSAATSQVDLQWIQATGTGSAIQYNDVGYGNGLWVAVGNSAYVAYSSDGQSWTTVYLDTIFKDDSNVITFRVNINGIAYDGSNKWIAVGVNGKMASSTNGSTWTEITSPFGTTTINTVLYAGNIWIAGGNSGLMYYSSDGTTWTSVTGDPFGTSAIQSIAYNAGKWIAVGASGKMFTSTTGITWTPVNVTSLFTYSSAVQTIKTVAYANYKWIAAASAGGLMATSYDGASWTAATGLGTSMIQSVAYGNSKWIAALAGGRTAVSTDYGNTWVVIPNTIFGSSNAINGIAFGNNKWVAVGATSKVAYAVDN